MLTVPLLLHLPLLLTCLNLSRCRGLLRCLWSTVLFLASRAAVVRLVVSGLSVPLLLGVAAAAIVARPISVIPVSLGIPKDVLTVPYTITSGSAARTTLLDALAPFLLHNLSP